MEAEKITHITEITGMEGETIVTQDIFSFEQSGFNENGKVVGFFKAHSIVPNFIQELAARGVDVDRAYIYVIGYYK